MSEPNIIVSFPPNIQQIQAVFPATENQVFAYSGAIYNPCGKEIEPHLKLHEQIHLEQQNKIGCDAWWYAYLTDKQFRLEQEVIAFATQYAFIKNTMPGYVAKEALHDFAVNLSSALYGGIIEKSKAESVIRHRAKEYGEKS